MLFAHINHPSFHELYSVYDSCAVNVRFNLCPNSHLLENEFYISTWCYGTNNNMPYAI